MISVDAGTRDRIWEGTAANAADVQAAVKAARLAFSSWSLTSLDQRKNFLTRFVQELSAQQNEFARLISQESGKPLWESATEIQAMLNKIPISCTAYDDRCREVTGAVNAAQRFTRFKPLGVAVVLGPFNLPGHLPNSHIIPALLAGNTIVFKPSELTPLTAIRMMQIWEKIGLPPGVINFLPGGRETGADLVRHPDINAVFFTGSWAAGQWIHQQFAGRPQVMLALEMGGNNPLIVHDISDLPAAAYLTIQSAFITSGQRCVCARRLIVPEGSPGDKFIAQLAALTDKIKVGLFTDKPEPFMGPVISPAAADKILQTQAQLRQKGGQVLLESRRDPRAVNLLTPGLMDVSAINDLWDEEIFGPLLQIKRVKNFEAAILEANRTRFGLAAGLLSDNESHYQRFYQLSRAGIVNWNRQITGASSEAPFGGIGCSGNYRPSAYWAADYCAFPVASIEERKLKMPAQVTPGIQI